MQIKKLFIALGIVLAHAQHGHKIHNKNCADRKES